jgi:Lrp/AsnC family leucine-responsive transcriptional regulator
MPPAIEMLRLTVEDCFKLSPLELETIVGTIARHGAVATSLVLRGEPPKRWSRPVETDLKPLLTGFDSPLLLTKAMFWIFAQT